MHEQYEFYKSTFDNLLEGCQIIGHDWRYLYLNSAAELHNHRPNQELLGNKYMDMWPGFESTHVFAVIKQSMEERTANRLEDMFVYPDGATGWFDLSIQPIPEGVFILSIDITERKQAEKRIVQMKRLYATLSQVNQTIVRVKDRNELYRLICDIAVKFGEFSLAWVGLLDEASGDVRPVAANGLDITQWPFPIVNVQTGEEQNGLIATALRISSVITSEDMPTDARLQDLSDQFQEYNYRSSAVIPFRLRGVTIGILNLVSNEVGFFKAEEEIHLLEEMGLDISFALDTMEIEIERKQAEEEIINLAKFPSENSSPVLRIARDGSLLYANPASAELLRLWDCKIGDRTPEEIQLTVYGSLGIGISRELEVAYGDRIQSLLFVPIMDKDYVNVYGRDITERKQAEEKIQFQNQRLKVLREIDTAVLAADSLENIVDVALSHIRQLVNCRRAALTLFDEETNEAEIFSVKEDHETSLQKGTRLPLALFEDLGKTLTQNQLILIKDLAQLPVTPPQFQTLLQSGIHSICILPLYSQGELTGTFGMFSENSDFFDEEKVSLGREVANQVAIAISEKRLIEDLRTLNIELEQRVAKRTEELSRTNTELEHANHAKDEFLATMSHELRTPLNSILGLSESLLEQRRDPLTEYQQQSLQIIASSGHHLLELINDVLDLSKIEAGMLDYYPQIVDVNSLCRSSLAFVKEQATRKFITLNYEEDKKVSNIYVDPRRVKQILVNLLNNAVKFTPDHGTVDLEVYDDEERDLIQFSVIDNGIGIAENDLKQLFQPFAQVDSKLNRQFEGTGLGLSLVQKLADLHGGSVEVESVAGKGSRFTVNLPWGRTIIAQQETSEKGGGLSTNKPLEKSTTPLQEPTTHVVVLLAEDNMANILTIGEYLKDHSYEVSIAHDGYEALKMAEESNPDIILMDIQMPAMNGLEATRRLRKDSRFDTTPIIALTALTMPGDRERCLEAGANEYMSKPISLKGLVKTIDRLLAK